MPNHITNIVKAAPHVLAALRGKESAVDFNALLPMPAGMAVECSTRVTWLADFCCGKISLQPTDTLGNLKSQNQITCLREGGALALDDAAFEQFVQCLRNLRAHGTSSWYDWSCQHWGTKWNAYDVSEEEGAVRFDTAWSPPIPMLEALAAKFPDDLIVLQWADADIGNDNCGTMTWLRGQVTTEEPEDRVDFGLTLKGRDRDAYRVNVETGKWEWDQEKSDAEEAEYVANEALDAAGYDRTTPRSQIREEHWPLIVALDAAVDSFLDTQEAARKLEIETMEEATLRIARKLEAHRWDLSVLSAAERAILSRP